MRVVLIDGNSFCYRAFYAIPGLRTSKGEPTNAVYGFITMLEKILKEIDPEGIAISFDLKGPTFRHKRYEAYKIHRPPMPDELVFQMPVIKKVVGAFRIPIFEKEGYEADDVMATLAKKLEAKGHEVYIVTADKDALQLVNASIKVLNPQKENFIYDEEKVRERFGVEPGRVVEVMALMGDASDNIPGVPGIGEKTAAKLITEFGTLDEVFRHLSKVKPDRLQESLKKYEEEARLSRELAQADCRVPLDVDVEALRRGEPDLKELAGLYTELEFRSLLKNLPVKQEKDLDPGLHYRLIQDRDSFEAFRKRLAKEEEWAFDFETTGTDPLLAMPIGISFCFKEKEAAYVSFQKPKEAFRPAQGAADFFETRRVEEGPMSAGGCLGSLKELFEDPQIRKIGQNLKYEIVILKNFGIRLAGVFFDTMVASYCLNPNKPNHNLDDIALEYLGVRITPITDLIGSGRNRISMEEVDLERLFRYGCQDSDAAYRASKVLKKKLKEEGLWDLFEEMELPLVTVLADMEAAGVAIDQRLLAEFSQEMEKSLRALTRKICQEAGQEFNINSPKQLGEILFVKLGLPVVKRTKTGASTDVEVLQELSEIHPLPREILKFRELSKLKSTYVDALPALVNPNTHRVHTSFNQTVTATGRLSSSEPNLQNIPARTEEGRKIRRAFIAGSKEAVLVSADYSQIELRVLAHLSGDENLTRAFREGADIHRYTASLIFNAPMPEVTEAMRDSAKTVNFGILYGMGAFSLAKSLGISNEAARDFIKAYFDRYPRVKEFLESLVEKARKEGFVSTAFKRRRYIPEISSRDARLKSFAERTAINAPIQGTASDIIKIAMRRIAGRLEKEGFLSKMILQVHDELVFEAPREELGRLVPMVVQEMQGAVSFKVPLQVSVKAGPNWLEMEEISPSREG
ncbi:MAG: DNA polymerase I [Candidatus Omnitrophica bacterium]|nr:DNA polymerase I [Candidatus Omnitrophota bacterium]